MKHFIKKITIIIVPLIVLTLVLFISTDIFKIFRHYNSYYSDRVALNRSFVTTYTYINQNDKRHFDSFIFGNSRSLSYLIDDWQVYIGDKTECFHFDEFGGSVPSLFRKMDFIVHNGGCIKNALFVIDKSLLMRMNQNEYLTCMPPVLINYKNILEFYGLHLKAFLDIRFQMAYWDYKLNNIYKPYMRDYIKSFIIDHDSVNCEYVRSEEESLIKDGKFYTIEKIDQFKGIQYPDSVSDVVIKKEQKLYLKKIKSILQKQDTNYKIIISPLFDQVKLNPKDLQTLNEIFGEERVFNFSGVNKWNANYHNYYEWSHYRPLVAKEILSIIYK